MSDKAQTQEPQAGSEANASPDPAGATKRRKAKKDRRIDLRGVIDAPIKVKQDGEVRSVHPHEVILRQHLRKALSKLSIPSIKFLIGEAEKYKVIKPPPPPPGGGVFIVPKGLPEDIEREIFDYRPEDGSREPISRILNILKRYFNGRRKQKNA